MDEKIIDQLSFCVPEHNPHLHAFLLYKTHSIKLKDNLRMYWEPGYLYCYEFVSI